MPVDDRDGVDDVADTDRSHVRGGVEELVCWRQHLDRHVAQLRGPGAREELAIASRVAPLHEQCPVEVDRSIVAVLQINRVVDDVDVLGLEPFRHLPAVLQRPVDHRLHGAPLHEHVQIH